MNAYSTLLLVIFLLLVIVLIVSALTVLKKKNIQRIMIKIEKIKHGWQEWMHILRLIIWKNKRLKSKARIAYKINRKNKLAAASLLSKLRPGYSKINLNGSTTGIKALNSLKHNDTQNLCTLRIVF